MEGFVKRTIRWKFLLSRYISLKIEIKSAPDERCRNVRFVEMCKEMQVGGRCQVGDHSAEVST